MQASPAFLSAALNDITWVTFGLVAALDRISLRMCAESTVPAPAPAAAPVLGRVAPAAAAHSALRMSSHR